MAQGNSIETIGDWRNSHDALVRLVNGEFRSLPLRTLNEIWPQRAFSAALKSSNFQDICQRIERDTNALQVQLPPCKTSNVHVSHMVEFIRQHLKEDLVSAILHGSLGTDEIVSYSDFDSLVILKDEVLDDNQRLLRVAQKLFQARRIMYQLDPLQHHGWFVLPEQALNAWPEDYLPLAVLKNASQMNMPETQTLQIKPVLRPGRSAEQFHNLAIAVRQNLTTGIYSTNLYQFKSMLSKVLLLPAMYVQARDNRGIFKRESFDLAKGDFSPADWAVMELASNIRLDWPLVKPAFPEFLSLRPGWIGNLWRRKKSCAIPDNLTGLFGDSQGKAVLFLIDKMQSALPKSGADSTKTL